MPKDLKEMNDEMKGQLAYEGYAEYTDWKSLASGCSLPQWKELPQNIQNAWIYSAKELLLLFND